MMMRRPMRFTTRSHRKCETKKKRYYIDSTSIKAWNFFVLPNCIVVIYDKQKKQKLKLFLFVVLRSIKITKCSPNDVH